MIPGLFILMFCALGLAKTLRADVTASNWQNALRVVPETDEIVRLARIEQGVNPQISVNAASGPERSESGIGALIAWADNLYVVSYLSVPNAGSGTGVYCLSMKSNGLENDSYFVWERIVAHNSTYANRIIHPGTNQAVIGPVVIGMDGTVKVLEELLTYRIGAMALDIEDPKTSVLMHGMDGYLFRVNLVNYTVTTLYDNLPEILNVNIEQGEQYHGKAAFSAFPNDGRAPFLLIGTNTFDESDDTRRTAGGRLAKWDGSKGTAGWSILYEDPTVEIAGRYNFGNVIFASQWDDRSAILRILDLGDKDTPSFDTNWQTYRLPFSSHAFEHLWQTEWTRIREENTERFIYDTQGGMFELSPLGWKGSVWGIKPLCTHTRIIPDFGVWRGMVVYAGNEAGQIFDNILTPGQSSSSLLFGDENTKFSWGKPQGWGGPWAHDSVKANSPSDPYLMTGYVNKVLHVRVEETNPFTNVALNSTVDVTVQVDFLGYAGKGFGAVWSNYTTIKVQPGTYQAHVFPQGYSAHWIRFVTNQDANATAYLTYTP